MKNFITIFFLIFLISLTAIIKTSSKKIEEEVFIVKENLSVLKNKYSLVLLEYTYLSNPSRLIKIIKNYKNEDYIHLELLDLKNLSKDYKKPSYSDLSKND
tara:strand:- start:1414 stop:1716 length:303 start_codon:yes stop_codon:yes gene_type:complete